MLGGSDLVERCQAPLPLASDQLIPGEFKANHYPLLGCGPEIETFFQKLTAGGETSRTFPGFKFSTK